ncbi:MAG: YqaJ viral recombinase family protein [Rhodoferax sp.]
MKTHSLLQGSPEWVAFRFQMRGASEAAAMLGLSSKMTRTELLHLKHTGNAKEFSDYVQERILDEGHRVEALARPIIAARIGQKLYPVTCSDGKQSASCDGLTMLEDIGWENKQWNQALAESVAAGELPEEYMPQCQQILKVTGAEKVIFSVSDGTEANTLTMEVLPDPEWFDRIDKGWAQFEIDLANYVPRVAEVKPVGKTPETLPALLVEVTGMVTNSNLEQYKEHALAVFAGINRELKTDQHFADAEKIVKWCGDVESRLEQVKEHALGQTQSIDTLFKTIDDIKAKARETRLELNKLVDKRKGEVKDEMVLGGKRAYETHLASLKEETGGLWVPIPQPDFAGAIKGKRSLDVMQDAVDTMLSVYKVAANDAAANIRANLAALKADGDGFEFLFNDRAVLIGKSLDDLKLLIKSRITDHKAAKEREEEATRERIRAEEQAKAEKDAREKLAAEQSAATAGLVKCDGNHGGKNCGDPECWIDGEPTRTTAPAPALTHPQVVQQMPASVRQAMAPKPATAPTMTLGTICERLGFNVTSAFLATLEFEATTVKAAKLYHESDFPAICDAIKAHISEVQEQFEPATA